MKPHKIILWFYAFYALMVCLGYILIDYPLISFFTLNIIFIYVSCLSIGAYIGYNKPQSPARFAFKISFEKLLAALLISGALLTATLWTININHYGSLEYIIFNSFTIRTDTIGLSDSIFPVYLTYTSSLIYPSFVLALVLYEKEKSRKYIFAACFVFLLIVLQDLLTFGRIGILYAIFSMMGYFIVFKKKLFTPRNIFIISALFLILMLPRLVRGSFDNMEGTVHSYLPHLNFDISPILYSFLSVYIYYFSSLFALDNYLTSNIDVYTFGQRTFTPVYNFISKLLGFERINTIDPMANIPFEYNIYTFVKDVYSDFSLAGVIVVPLFIGYFFGFFSKNNRTSDQAIKIYMLAWLFYTPLFNAFSFGGFLIGFFFLIFLTLFRSKNEGLNNNCQL